MPPLKYRLRELCSTVRSTRSRSPRKRLSNRGFTLIELMIVIAIIGILATAALPTYRHATKKAREAVLKQQLYVMRDVLDQYYQDKGNYPPDLTSLDEDDYLRRVPIDPMTLSRDSWTTEYDEVDAQNPEAESGIRDVFSGSNDLGTNGLLYSEW